jgi:Fe-S-cluster containining protein
MDVEAQWYSMSSIPEVPPRIHTGVLQPDPATLADACTALANARDGYVRIGGCTTGCGACCEHVILALDPYVTADKDRFEDWVRWADLHHIIVVNDDRGLRAFIPLRCDALQDDGLCGIYDDRPDMCKRFPQTREGLESVRNVCTYVFMPTSDLT